MKILIDNGHGVDTPGKCSPDKRLREYAYTREIADTKLLATDMALAAKSKGVKVRIQAKDHSYCEEPLYICRHTNCPAVLIENFFQDNREDVAFLLSEEGKQCVTDITVEGIKRYLSGK